MPSIPSFQKAKLGSIGRSTPPERQLRPHATHSHSSVDEGGDGTWHPFAQWLPAQKSDLRVKLCFYGTFFPPTIYAALVGQVTQFSSKLWSLIIVTSSLKTSESLPSVLQCLRQDSKWDPWELGPRATFHIAFAASVPRWIPCNPEAWSAGAWPSVFIARGGRQNHLGWRILVRAEPPHCKEDALDSSGCHPIAMLISEADAPASTFL